MLGGKRYMHPNVHSSIIYNCQGMEASPPPTHTHTLGSLLGSLPTSNTHTHTHTPRKPGERETQERGQRKASAFSS